MHRLDIMKLFDDTKNFTNTHNSECTNYIIIYNDTTKIGNTDALCVCFERYLVQGR